MTLVITRLIKGVVRTLSVGFAVMLLLGSLHDRVSASVPPLGYWPSVWLAFLVMWIVAGTLTEAAADIRTDMESED